MQNVTDAIKYAEENGAQICNLSLASLTQHESLKKIIMDSKMMFVVPSGNHGMELSEEFKCYPASYECDNLITVGALGEDNALIDCSNYGDKYVDVYCNGVIAFDGEMYEGTSIACARESAVCALKLRD